MELTPAYGSPNRLAAQGISEVSRRIAEKDDLLEGLNLMAKYMKLGPMYLVGIPLGLTGGLAQPAHVYQKKVAERLGTTPESLYDALTFDGVADSLLQDFGLIVLKDVSADSVVRIIFEEKPLHPPTILSTVRRAVKSTLAESLVPKFANLSPEAALATACVSGFSRTGIGLGALFSDRGDSLLSKAEAQYRNWQTSFKGPRLSALAGKATLFDFIGAQIVCETERPDPGDVPGMAVTAPLALGEEIAPLIKDHLIPLISKQLHDLRA